MISYLYDQIYKVHDDFDNMINDVPDGFNTWTPARQKVWTVNKAKEILDIKEDLDRRVLHNPLKYYCPTGKQEEYIRTVANSVYADKNGSSMPIIGFFAANGVGKTETTIHILANIILGAQNKWFNYPLFRNFPYPKKCWYVSTGTGIKNVVVPEMMRLLKNVKCDFRKEGKPHISKVVFEEWEIIFKTFDQDKEQFESDSPGIIILDEPAPEFIWNAIKARRRMGCITLLPMTPLDTRPYLKDEFTTMEKNNEKGYFLVTADVFSSCKKRGIRGFQDPDRIDEIINGYPAEELFARAYGQFTFFFGKVYSEFNKQTHVVSPEDYPIDENDIIIHSVDPHDSRDNAEVWVARKPNGRYIVVAETPDNDGLTPFWSLKRPVTIPEDIARMESVETKLQIKHGFKIAYLARVMDRHYGTQQLKGRTGTETTTIMKDYAEAGVNFESSYKSPNNEKEIAYGHSIVRKLLRIMPDGKPGLLFYNTCFHAINGMEHYIYKRNVGDGDDRSGELVEKYKDFPDAIRYAVCTVSNPRKIEDILEEKNRVLDIKKYAENLNNRAMQDKYGSYRSNNGYDKPLMGHILF